MYWYYQFRRWNNMGECPVLFVENVQCLFRANGNVGIGHVFRLGVGTSIGHETGTIMDMLAVVRLYEEGGREKPIFETG